MFTDRCQCSLALIAHIRVQNLPETFPLCVFSSHFVYTANGKLREYALFTSFSSKHTYCNRLRWIANSSNLYLCIFVFIMLLALFFPWFAFGFRYNHTFSIADDLCKECTASERMVYGVSMPRSKLIPQFSNRIYPKADSQIGVLPSSSQVTTTMSLFAINQNKWKMVTDIDEDDLITKTSANTLKRLVPIWAKSALRIGEFDISSVQQLSWDLQYFFVTDMLSTKRPARWHWSALKIAHSPNGSLREWSFQRLMPTWHIDIYANDDLIRASLDAVLSHSKFNNLTLQDSKKRDAGIVAVLQPARMATLAQFKISAQINFHRKNMDYHTHVRMEIDGIASLGPKDFTLVSGKDNRRYGDTFQLYSQVLWQIGKLFSVTDFAPF